MLSVDNYRIIQYWRNPQSLGQRIFWIVFPIYVFVIYLRNVDGSKSVINQIFLSMLTLSASYFFLLFIQKQISKNLKIPSALLTVVVYILMGLLNGLSSRVVFTGTSSTQNEILLAILINSLFVVVAFSITSYSIISIQDLRKSLKNREIQYARAITNLRDAEQNFYEEEFNLQKTVDTRITPVLKEVERIIQKLKINDKSDELKILSQQIQIISIEPLRKISHEYAVRDESRSRIFELLTIGKFNWRQRSDFLKVIFTSIRPPNYSALIVLNLIMVLIVQEDCRPRTLLMNLILLLIIFTARTLSRLDYFIRPDRMVLLTLSSLVLATIIWAGIYNSPDFACSNSQSPGEVVIACIGIAVLLLSSGIYSEVFASGLKAEGEINDGILSIQSEQLVIDQELIALRRRVSEVMHGPVIGRFAAISLICKDFADKNTGKANIDLEPLQKKIDPLIKSIKSELAFLRVHQEIRKDFETEIDEIVQYWRGLIDVQYQISPRLLDLDPETPAQLSIPSICQELITNANRHANARKVGITVELIEGDGRKEAWKVHIRCSDNGSRGETIQSGGIGLASIVSAGGSWTITHLHTVGNTVEIDFPYFARV